MAGANDMSL